MLLLCRGHWSLRGIVRPLVTTELIGSEWLIFWSLISLTLSAHSSGCLLVMPANPGIASSTNSASSAAFIFALLRLFFLDSRPSTAAHILESLSSLCAFSLYHVRC